MWARFDGLDASRIDESVAEMKQQLNAGRSGEVPEGAPAQVGTLMETAKRFVELVDRDNGTAVGIVFCNTDEDMRRADEALNEMSPDEGRGRRTSVDIYEVAIDEVFA